MPRKRASRWEEYCREEYLLGRCRHIRANEIATVADLGRLAGAYGGCQGIAVEWGRWSGG